MYDLCARLLQKKRLINDVTTYVHTDKICIFSYPIITFMNLKNLFIRSQNLLRNPVSEFELIAGENPDTKMVNNNFVLPVSALVSAFALFGSAFSNITSPINSFLYVVINAGIVFLLVFSHVYISGKLIALLGNNITDDRQTARYYALSAYAQLPFFLVLALIKLFPSLIFLVFLGLYSAFLFHTGTAMLSRIPAGKRIQFTLLSVLIMITSFIVCSELYTLLYVEIIEQFTTFAAL